MGRYSLVKKGIISASSVPYVKISPEDYGAITVDEDGIRPITDQDRFKDDAANRFVDFVSFFYRTHGEVYAFSSNLSGTISSGTF